MSWFRRTPRMHAQLNGETVYVSDTQCKEHKMFERYTANCKCIECNRIEAQKYRERKRNEV